MTLLWRPALEHLDLLSAPVTDALRSWPHVDQVEIAAIDPAIADTQALVEASDVELEDCANCIVVLGQRAGEERIAACLVLGTARADVNRTVRKAMNVRRISFLSMDRAVQESTMEYGGITPLGLPDDWAVLVDPAVLERERIVVGAGVRAAKLRLPGALADRLPGAQVVPGLALPSGTRVAPA